MRHISTFLVLASLLSGGFARAYASDAMQTYVLEPGTGHTVTVDSPLTFYDDGGADANITPGFAGTVTFIPAHEGKVLMLNAEEFSIGGGKMYVYSGHDVDAAAVVGKGTGYSTTTGPSNVLSKAADGSLTVDFKAHATASTLKGWVMSVTSLDAVKMDVGGISVSPGVAGDVVRGSGDVPVVHLEVTVSGNSGKVAVSGVGVDFSGSSDIADIQGAKVFYTGTNGVFAPVTPVCDAVTRFDAGKAELVFNRPVEFDAAGVYHLWVAADISGQAVAGNSLTAAVTSVSTTGEAVTVPAENAATVKVKAGLGGTFRIGASDDADYHSLAEAVDALAAGVEASVLFMLEDGVYKENITVADIQGGTATHPVVFSSLSGNRDKVVISGAGVLADRGVVTVDNSSYVHFRNLTVSVPKSETSDESYSAILFRNGSRHCSIENCIIRADVTGGAETSLVRVADGGNVENTNCDYLTVKDSYFDGGYIAMYASGAGFVALPKVKGISVTDNVFANPYFKGIYVNDCQDFTVAGNNITSETARKSYNAIDIYRPHGAYRVTGNKVSMLQSTDGTGIYLRIGGGLSDQANPALVANNVVVIPNAASAYTYGIMQDASIQNVIVAHNSVNVKGASTLKSVFALAFSSTAPANGAAMVCNNILQNSTASGPLRPWDASHYGNLKFSGNVYYGGSEVMDGDGKTFAEYQEATGDNSSVWMQAEFFSDSDLHLRSAGEAMAMPRLEAVTHDAEGTERPEKTTAGAYEYAPVVAVAPEIMDGYPALGTVKDVSATVNTRWTVGGSLYAKAVKASSDAPSRDELMRTRPVACDADVETPYTFNFLDQLTEYKAYFLMVSALGEESQIVASPLFSTIETIEPLMAVIDWDEEPVAAGESIVLQAYAVGGKEPYTYQWVDQMNEPVGSSDLFTCEASVNQTYRLEITSADGQTARTKALVPVIAPTLSVATFDDLFLEPESNWMFDPDATAETVSDAFFSGSFRFGNFPMVQYGAWCGYGYANETATEFNDDYTNQFRNVVGGGAAKTDNYGVAYMMYADTRINVSASDKGLVIPGVYITNAAVTAEKILLGDTWCPKFTAENGDYMTLKIYGYDAEGKETGVVDAVLADFRGEYGEAGGYVLSDWKWFDLSQLGAVNTLKLDYESTQKDFVPGYACFDQLGAYDPSSALDGVSGAVSEIRVRLSARDCLTILGAEGDYTLRLFSVDGVLHATHNLNGAATVSIADFPAGACIAEVVTADGSSRVLRFMKKL